MPLRAINADGSKGSRGVTKKFEGLRGDSIFFASGDIDVCVAADLPDNETVAAASLAVNQSGVVTAKVVVLMTPEEVDKAAKIHQRSPRRALNLFRRRASNAPAVHARTEPTRP